METKFIKYPVEKVNLTQLYRRAAHGTILDSEDVQYGTIVVGYSGNGKYTAMGYLRGMTQSKETGKMLYEIANAIEDEYTTCIEDACRVDIGMLPYVAAVVDPSMKPIVGKVTKCNGEIAYICDGSCTTPVNVNSIYTFTRYFKETK